MAMTTERKLIEKLRELIKFYESFHTYSATKVYNLKSEISALEKEAEQKSEPALSAEDILKRKIPLMDDEYFDIVYKKYVLEAMEEYRQAGIREESKKLCCDCKNPLPKDFIYRCPDCWEHYYFP
jgi:hypothetical protein